MHATLCDTICDIACNALEAGAAHVAVSLDARGGLYRVTVADDGVGMDSEEQERALESTYSQPGKHPGRAEGLGLPWLKALVSQCEGSLSVVSARGQGTKVSFSLSQAAVGCPALGDWPGTVAVLAARDPEVALSVTRESDVGHYQLALDELGLAPGAFMTPAGSKALRTAVHEYDLSLV